MVFLLHFFFFCLLAVCFLALDLLDGLLEVRDEVLHVLESDRDADHVAGESLLRHHLRGDTRVRHRRGVLDERVERAERDGEAEQPHVLADGFRRVVAALRDEREGAAEAAHLLHGDLVSGERLQARVEHPLDLRVALEEARDGEPVGADALHAERERAEPAHDEERVERRHQRAVVLPPVEDLRHDVLRLGDAAPADDVAVPVDVLGDRVDDDVRAELQRALEDGGRERVVDDDHDAVLLGELADRLDVRDAPGRVRGGLEVDHLGVVADGLRDLLDLRRVDGGGLDAVLRDGLEEAHGAAVQRVAPDHVLARVHERPHGARDGAHAGAERRARDAALHLGDELLELVHGGVAEARVDVALLLAREQVGALLDVVEDERGRLEDGEDVRVADVGLGAVEGAGHRDVLVLVLSHCFRALVVCICVYVRWRWKSGVLGRNTKEKKIKIESKKRGKRNRSFFGF